ncbi:hypothetical protein Nepgr_029404 [Nepenthes gracilis]|uniref:Uncharacterized protein n=1 Tax=Nepenthes gracilis TaxID=150966 RepID=A0AAD3TEV2_NEPGR|nr:hypothetical protein Nepgr_029404 [Nepenthes gracilis]
MKSINFSRSPPPPRTTNPIASAPLILSIKLKLQFTFSPFNKTSCTGQSTIISLNPWKRRTSLFLTLCSTKADEAAEGNRTAEFRSDYHQHSQAKPTSSQPPSSSSSSSSSPAGGLVFDFGLKESWDGVEIGSPVVKRFLGDDEERWYMWYYGRSSENPDADSIGLATSSNGSHWERGQEAAQSSTDVGLVMTCGGDWWAFDTRSIRPSDVMIMSSEKVRSTSSVYWLYYTGFSSEETKPSDSKSLTFSLQNPERISLDEKNWGHNKVYKSLPGLAISQDGRNWARIEGEHHSGALFDVGSEGKWDSLFIASPHVVFHGAGDIRMYYHSFDQQTEKFAIGVARSRDGIRWTKLGKVTGGGSSGGFDELGATNACVVRSKRDGNYLMAYEGVAADGGRSIGMAMSHDGLKDWRRISDRAILRASSGDGWDSKGVGSPYLVLMSGNDDEEWRLYYRGIGEGGKTGIGMAISIGEEIGRFRRWAGSHF